MGNTLRTPNTRSDQNPQNEEEKGGEGGGGGGAIEEENSSFTCEICVEPMLLPNRKFKNRDVCAHPFCVDCMIKYIQLKVDDEHAAAIRCPALNCEQSLDPISCRLVIPPTLFDKWCDSLCDSALLGFDRCYCPNRDCSVLVLNECGGNVKRSLCPNCKRLFCFQCKLPWHAGYRCEESGEMRDRNDIVFGVLVEMRRWMRCPQCHHVVELIEGCKIVKCRCGTSFCYKCGRKVYKHWCRCERTSECCVWAFRICIILLFLLGILCLYWDATKR